MAPSDFLLRRLLGRVVICLTACALFIFFAPKARAQSPTLQSQQDTLSQQLSCVPNSAATGASSFSNDASSCGNLDTAYNSLDTYAPDFTSGLFLASPAGDSAGSDSFTNGPNDWIHRWMGAADKAQSEEPKDAAPLITTHVALAQLFRFDSYYQTAKGYETEDYGAMKGLELIPNSHFEVQVSPPPYFYHQAPGMPDGWGDASIFLKLRVASAPDTGGGYFFGFFLGGEFPTGAAPNGKGHTIWTPAIGGAKRWRFFDWQSTFGASLPQSGTATLGRDLDFNNTFQFSIHDKIWPELEDNATFFVDGPDSGKKQNFLTPGVILGSFRIGERLKFETGAGIQIATTGFHMYNHRWIWTARFPF